MSEEPQLTVPREFARLLQAAVDAGEYPSADAALADALSGWAKRHEDAAEDLAWVRAQLKSSLADPDPDLSEEEVDARLRSMFERAERDTDEAA